MTEGVYFTMLTLFSIAGDVIEFMASVSFFQAVKPGIELLIFFDLIRERNQTIQGIPSIHKPILPGSICQGFNTPPPILPC